MSIKFETDKLYEFAHIKISNKFNQQEKEYFLMKNQNISIQNKEILNEFSYQPDFILNYTEKCCILKTTSSSYIQVPSPIKKTPLIFYIYPEIFDNEVLIGSSKIQFQARDDEHVHFTAINKSGTKRSEGDAPAKNCIIQFGKNMGMLKSFKDNKLSSIHCYIGFNKAAGIFYVIDYGTEGNGSSRWTFVKIKNGKPIEIHNYNTFRVKNDSHDYNMKLELRRGKIMDIKGKLIENKMKELNKNTLSLF